MFSNISICSINFIKFMFINCIISTYKFIIIHINAYLCILFNKNVQKNCRSENVTYEDINLVKNAILTILFLHLVHNNDTSLVDHLKSQSAIKFLKTIARIVSKPML